MRSLLIIGSGGHGRSVLDCALATGEYGEIVFASNEDEPTPIPGYEILDERKLALNDIQDRFNAVAVAIGDNRARLLKTRALLARGIGLPAFVHPCAYVSPLASVGTGSVVLAGAVVNAFAEVGTGCIVNTCAVVEHECRLGDGVHLSPGAVVAGGSSVGEGSWLCANSVVSDHVGICPWVTVGAGGCVIRDISEPGVYVGVPVRKIGGLCAE